MEAEERVGWKTYNGKKYIEITYRDLGGEENDTAAIEVLDYVHKFVLNAGKEQIVLTDVTDAYATPEIMKILKANLRKERPLNNREAVVGITGAKSALLRTLNFFSGSEVKPFDTKEQALLWLFKEENADAE